MHVLAYKFAEAIKYLFKNIKVDAAKVCLIAAVAPAHPRLSEEHVRAIALALADELHLELLHRSQRWNRSPDPGAMYREAESRACVSIVFALGEVA